MECNKQIVNTALNLSSHSVVRYVIKKLGGARLFGEARVFGRIRYRENRPIKNWSILASRATVGELDQNL